MINVALLVDAALKDAGIPFEGVSIGNVDDRTTWRVAFTADATPAQRTTAAQIVATVIVDASAQALQAKKDVQAAIDAMPIFEKAIVLALIDQLNVIRSKLVPPLADVTPAQALNAIRNKAGTL